MNGSDFALLAARAAVAKMAADELSATPPNPSGPSVLGALSGVLGPAAAGYGHLTMHDAHSDVLAGGWRGLLDKLKTPATPNLWAESGMSGAALNKFKTGNRFRTGGLAATAASIPLLLLGGGLDRGRAGTQIQSLGKQLSGKDKLLQDMIARMPRPGAAPQPASV